jgi:hypothetical protein
MLKIVADFYKVLFGREDKSSLSLKEDFWDVGDKVTEEENEELQAPFLEDEVKAVVFSRYPEGAPGPDGLPFLFFQKFWGVVREDIMNIVRAFQEGPWTYLG